MTREKMESAVIIILFYLLLIGSVLLIDVRFEELGKEQNISSQYND